MKRLAYSFKKQGKTEEMIIEYERILDSGDRDADTLRDLASAYGDQGRTDEQVSVLKKILSFDPNNSAIQSELARVYESSGEDPLEIFKARFEDNPENACLCIRVCRKINETMEILTNAIEALENTLSYNDANNMVYLTLGNAYNENSDFDEAIKMF